MKKNRALALVAALAATTAFGQGTAVLTGTVTDASSNAPVADVVVTATSPNLQGEQVVVTDATGSYRIPQLPSGVYTIRLEKETYRPYSRGGIAMRSDATVRVNVQLLPEAIQGGEEEVIGRAPTIDVGSTSTGVSVGSDFIKNIAVVRPGGKGSASRSFESLAELAPGAQGDAFGVSISGTSSPENNYMLDGVSVNDPAFGVNGTQLSVEFMQEVNVISGGYLPEYGRATGGVVAAVTKSGSNEFHGSVFGTWTPGALEGAKKTILVEGGTVTGVNRLHNLGDFGAELGGPILKDKLWFYAGIAPSFQRQRITRTLNRTLFDPTTGDALIDPETSFTQTEPLPGAEQTYFADQRTLQYIGKLTFNINQDNNLTLSVIGTPTTSGGSGRYAISPNTGGSIQVINGTYDSTSNIRTSGGNDVSAKYSSAFLDKRLLLDVTGGWHHQNNATHPSDDTTPGTTNGLAGVPTVRFQNAVSITDYETLNQQAADLCQPDSFGNLPCAVSQYTVGGPGFIADSVLDRYQGRAMSTLLLTALGHHVIKAGVDGELMVFDQNKAYSGSVFYQVSTNGQIVSDFRRYGFLNGPDQVVEQAAQHARSTSQAFGGFLQDSWNVLDLVTINAGVRYDQQALIGTDDRTALFLPNQWSPRIGLIYDFTREGRSKVFASYARYFESVPLDLVDRGFPGERQLRSSRYFTGQGPGGTGNCDPTDPAQYRSSDFCLNPNLLIPKSSFGDPNRVWGLTGGVPETVDSALKPQSTDEIVAGLEYELFANARVGASYTRRVMVNVIEDMSRDDGTTYFIGNPHQGIASDFPEAVRDYDAATVYFNKNFADLWLAQVSYTWSRAFGNYPGLFRPETLQLDPNINSDFDLISLLPNRTGLLPGNATHSIKAFVAKEFAITQTFSTNFGLSYRATSGNPISALVGHPIYGPDEGFLIPRGNAGTLPWTHRIDATLGLNYKVSKDSIVTLGVDVFNVFNFAQVVAVDETFTTETVLPLSSEDCGGHTCTAADIQIVGPHPTDSSFNEATVNGNPIISEDTGEVAEINKNFKRPTAYQAPRSIRFALKVTF
jgi:hypothetical protein